MGVEFYDDGSFQAGILAADSIVEVRGRSVKLKAATQVSFYRDGTVIQGFLAAEMVVDVRGREVRFKANASPQWPDFHFYENGVLSEGTLAEEAVFELKGRKLTLYEGFYLRFDEEGNLTGFQS
jgi:hypothetical protein